MDFLSDLVGQNGPVTLQAKPRSYENPDDALLVKFYWEAVPNKAKSDTEGRSVHDQIEFVEITVIGGDTVVRKASQQDRLRFKRQYDDFLAGNQKPSEGTLLESWPALNVAQVADLKFSRIFTVEQLAALHDEQLRVLGPGGLSLRQKARDFIDASTGMAPLLKLREEYQQLKLDHELLKDEFRKKFGQEPQVNREMVSKILEEAKEKSSEEIVIKKKRGRPKKDGN